MPILATQFVPDRNKKPQQLIRKSEEKKTGAQVPPPAAHNPPSVLQGPDQAQTATQLRNPPKDDNPLNPDNWPDWLRWLIFYVLVPLAVLLLVYGAIRGAKWLRRRRRRTTGGMATRVTGGWREIIDTARDLRMPVPAKGTRIEQARALELHVDGPPPPKPSVVVDGQIMGAPRPALDPSVRTTSSGQFAPDSDTEPLPADRGEVLTRPGPGVTTPARPGLALVPVAAAANGHVFDVDEPTSEEVDAFWADVETARKRIRGEQSFWQKLRGDVSLRTFRDHLPTGSGLGPALARTSRRQGKAEPARRGRAATTKAGVGTSAPGDTRASRRAGAGRSSSGTGAGKKGDA
jgi:hypothetical protein